MRSRTLVAAGLLAGLLASPAPADEGYRHGRVRFVDPGVTLQRATEASAEEALANLPFLPGDRVWTDHAGRAEFQFPGGTLVRLDRRSKLDYAGHEEDGGERVVLRLWSGSAIVRAAARGFGRFEIDTPAGSVQALEGSGSSGWTSRPARRR
jgi:ferric-dicitrate binding protein FerR (iron transport regulator)